MLQEYSKQVIAAYVLNCPLQEASQRPTNAAQKADIAQLEHTLESCIEAITPLLKEHGEAVVEERNYRLFALMPSNMAIKLINDELRQLGVSIDEESLKQSLALALDNSNGFILKTAV